VAGKGEFAPADPDRDPGLVIANRAILQLAEENAFIFERYDDDPLVHSH
jgi:hypothetical protein